jgi:cyclopropane fatty-acyl-phospholipid synthase-like methyltransferase
MTTPTSASGVRSFFRSEAARFDSIYTGPRSMKERLIDRLFHRVIRLRFERTLELLAPVDGKRFLDVGCGPGHYMVELAARGGREAVGIDFAEEMLDLARQAATARGVEDRCRYVAGDFLSSDPGGTFDACVAIGYFEYLEQPLEHMRRMVELTRGQVIASFPKRYTLRTGPRALRYRLRGCYLRFYTAGEIRRLAEAAGLTDIEVLSISRDYLLHARTPEPAASEG